MEDEENKKFKHDYKKYYKSFLDQEIINKLKKGEKNIFKVVKNIPTIGKKAKISSNRKTCNGVNDALSNTENKLISKNKIKVNEDDEEDDEEEEDDNDFDIEEEEGIDIDDGDDEGNDFDNVLETTHEDNNYKDRSKIEEEEDEGMRTAHSNHKSRRKLKQKAFDKTPTQDERNVTDSKFSSRKDKKLTDLKVEPESSKSMRRSKRNIEKRQRAAANSSTDEPNTIIRLKNPAKSYDVGAGS